MDNQESPQQVVGGFELQQKTALQFKGLLLERSRLVNAGRMYSQSYGKGDIDHVL